MRNGNRTPHPGIRRDGKDQYTVRVTTRDPTTGRQREKERKVMGTLTEAIAAREELRAHLAAELDDGAARIVVKQNRSTETVGDFAKRWLVHLTRTGRNRAHVIKGRVDMLERFILPSMADMRVCDVERAHVVAWMESLSDMRHHGKPYAKATLKGAWGTLRTLLKDALVLCDLDKDPTLGVRFHVRGNDEKPKEVLTQDELVRLLEGAEPESPDVRAMVWLGFTTGMRFGELSALTWGDIDEVRGLIHVRRSQVNGIVGKTKTRTARSVPLHPTVKAILDEHREWLSQRLPDHPLVFPSRTGTYRSPSMLKNPLRRAAARGGVDKHVSSHTMRRTFNNLARQAAGET